jgi:hypothetical protein
VCVKLFLKMDDPPAREGNSFTSIALFASSVCIDALTAHDVRGPSGHAPTSLRVTSVVLAACLASPPLRKWMVLEQRAVLGAALLAAAIAGEHAGASAQRAADASFVSLVFGALLYTFCVGGTDTDHNGRAVTNRSRDAAPWLKRETVISLTLAIWFYSSIRVARIGFLHPVSVRDFVHYALTYDGSLRTMQGYAYASSTGAAALSFGGAVGASAAIALLLDSELRVQGTASATMVLTVASMAQLTAAFLATLSQSDAVASLPVVWSRGACASGALCEPAIAARRLALINQCASALWVNGIGALVLAHAPSLRMRSRTQMLSTPHNFDMFVCGLVGATICTIVLYGSLFLGPGEAVIDTVCVGAVVAVFVTAFVDSLVGVAAFDFCLLWTLYDGWPAEGLVGVFADLAQCYQLLIVALLTWHVLVRLFVEVLWRSLPRELLDACDRVLGAIATAGTSAAMALYLAASAAAASYEGHFVDDSRLTGAENRFARMAAVGILEHWLPLLVWLPLYGCRCETEQLSQRARALAWYASGLLPVVIWLLALGARTQTPAHGAAWVGTNPFAVSVWLVAVVPWSVLPWG